MKWFDAADQAQGVLVERFWDGDRGLFRIAERRRFLTPAHWHYWWQAHALEATADLVARTGDAAAVVRLRRHVAGILHRNGGRISNDYYDDMEWMALALLRAGDLVGVDAEHARGLVDELWSTIRAGWDQRSGGIVWRRGDTYTNVPANAPAAILAARLFRQTAGRSDLEWARRIVDWLHATLVDEGSGRVWDGIHPDRDARPSAEEYTYNAGTVVGADVELAVAAGDGHLLDRAAEVAAAALHVFAEPTTLLLPLEGDGDRALFKGILARYLGEFVMAMAAWEASDEAGPAPTTVQTGRRAVVVLERNGTAVTAASRGVVGPDWHRPGHSAGSLAAQLSAVLLLETLSRLEVAGLTGMDEAGGIV